MTHKKQQNRVDVRWPVTVFSGTRSIEGITRNITGAGMMILSDRPLQLYENYRITVRLPNYLDQCLNGRVIWSNLYGIDEKNVIYGMGFCFLQASDSDRSVLNALVSQFTL